MICQREGCENEVVQPPVGRRRKFCTPECTQAHWNTQASRESPGPPRHRVEIHDEKTRRATCSICGEVKAHRVRDKYADGRPRIRWVCPNRVRESSRESRKRFQSSEKGRQLNFRTRYGLTREEAETALAKRGDGCEICGDREHRLVYDHCHTTGRHRGWLCDACNFMLGKAQDDPERLRAAADYLERG